MAMFVLGIIHWGETQHATFHIIRSTNECSGKTSYPWYSHRRSYQNHSKPRNHGLEDLHGFTHMCDQTVTIHWPCLNHKGCCSNHDITIITSAEWPSLPHQGRPQSHPLCLGTESQSPQLRSPSKCWPFPDLRRPMVLEYESLHLPQKMVQFCR